MESSTQRLLTAWEGALPLSPANRALDLVAVLSGGESRRALAEMTVGQRDAELMRLREAAFGPAVEAVAPCPDCDETVALSFDLDTVRVSDTDRTPFSATTDPIVIDDWSVTYRMPTSGDLIAIEACPSEDAARSMLLSRCTDVRHDGEPEGPDGLPPEVLAALDAALTSSDMQADVQLAVMCPDCGAAWQQSFDIGSFLWTELDTWARRVLSEIHVLARAYGWSETEILDLSPLRRRAYLEMVAA